MASPVWQQEAEEKQDPPLASHPMLIIEGEFYGGGRGSFFFFNLLANYVLCQRIEFYHT